MKSLCFVQLVNLKLYCYSMLVMHINKKIDHQNLGLIEETMDLSRNILSVRKQIQI
jgi:hypothetical protein